MLDRASARDLWRIATGEYHHPVRAAPLLRGDHIMQKRSILRAAATAVGGALLVTACSSGGATVHNDSSISVKPGAGTGATNVGAPDSCALVNTADASALFGHPATLKTMVPLGDGVCAWGALGNLPDGRILQYSLVAKAYNGTAAYTEAKVPAGHRVANVGQRAYAYTIGRTHTIETVGHNKTLVLIYTVHTGSGTRMPNIADQDARLTTLARTAVSRL
jgi:hypothetical protein